MTTRETMQQALALASEGNFQAALTCLDKGIQEAEAMQKTQEVDSLARKAAIVADQSGDLAKAEDYYRRALRANEINPLTHFALADVLKRQGKNDLATTHLVRSFDLANSSGDQDVLELLVAVGFTKAAD